MKVIFLIFVILITIIIGHLLSSPRLLSLGSQRKVPCIGAETYDCFYDSRLPSAKCFKNADCVKQGSYCDWSQTPKLQDCLSKAI